MSIITIFEKNNFETWTKDSINRYKSDIINRAFSMGLCFAKQREIEKYRNYMNILNKKMDNIMLFVQKAEEGIIMKTCLGNFGVYIRPCISPESLTVYGINKSLEYDDFINFIKNLSYFTTDATIIEWKIKNGISYETVTVYNKFSKLNAQFPVSYETEKLISEVKSEYGYDIVFQFSKEKGIVVSNKYIVCNFVSDRFIGEYIIQFELINLLLRKEGFVDIENCTIDGTLSEDNLKIILNCYYQFILISKLLKTNYKYLDDDIYMMLDYQINGLFFKNMYDFLCSYFQLGGFCSDCDINCGGTNQDCPILSSEGLVSRYIFDDRINTSGGHKSIINEILNKIEEREGYHGK